MEQRQYHCFVAGLPEISFDGSGLWTTPAKFVEEMRRELHPDDFRMVTLMLLRYDHPNFIRFLQGNDTIPGDVGLFSRDDYSRQQEIFQSIVPEENILPPYMSDILFYYSSKEKPVDHLECRRKLDDGYYRWARTQGSRFVREYIGFEYDLSNMLTYLLSLKSGSNQPDEGLAGESSFTLHLHETAGKNLMKDPEFEYFDEILSVYDSYTLAEAEIRYDRLRWDVAGKLTLFDFFTVDAVLAYFQKLMIASRWLGMTTQAGREKLSETMNHALEEIQLH